MKKSVQEISIYNSTQETEIKIQFATLRKATLSLRALDHPVRKKILSIIEEKEKITVTEIQTMLRIEQSIVSQHLALLRKANFLKATRVGKLVFYSTNYSKIEDAISFLDKITLV